jgi:hypothetical protein
MTSFAVVEELGAAGVAVWSPPRKVIPANLSRAADLMLEQISNQNRISRSNAAIMGKSKDFRSQKQISRSADAANSRPPKTVRWL